MARKSRQFYIDNLRIVLTALVVLHHLAIAYGGPGLWYYNEVNTSNLASIFLSLFVATNQSFFMGMFFMISAFFLEKSMRRKRLSLIAKDRFKRLGIPIIFYALILSPLIVYLVNRYDKGLSPSFTEFYQTQNWLTFGPLWFIMALLFFTVVALLYRRKQADVAEIDKNTTLPSWKAILGFALLIALASFFLRIWFPVGWTLDPVGFQLGHFGQYIALYIIGFVASKNNWFDQIGYRQSICWLRVVALMVFVLFPLVFYFGGALTEGPEVFMGGFTGQSLVYCIWEQIVGIGIIVGLLGVFKEKFNYQKESWKEYSGSAYTVYIIHAIVLVSASLLIKNLYIPAWAKFLLLAPITLIFCFWIANRIRRIPIAKNIL